MYEPFLNPGYRGNSVPAGQDFGKSGKTLLFPSKSKVTFPKPKLWESLVFPQEPFFK
jgi:hypothetical protein